MLIRYRWHHGAALLLLVAPVAVGEEAPPPGIKLHRNVVFGKGGDQELRLDLARPVTSEQRIPVVLLLHGGAWRGGKKDEQGMTSLVYRFAASGYAAASAEYRLCPKHRFPAQVEDVKCAVRFLRAKADEYQLDPRRIGVVGLSAGAHLAMLLGTTGGGADLEGQGGWMDQTSEVQAVVSVAGPTELDAPDIPAISIPLVSDLIGGAAQEKPQEYKQASPVTHVSPGDAPMLLFQGTKDPLVPHTQAYRMTDALTKAGIPGRVELYVGAGHGWGGKDLEHTLRVTDEFLARYLKAGP